MSIGKRYRAAKSAANKAIFGSNTNALRQKLKVKRAVKRGAMRARATGYKAVGKAINKVTGSTGGVYKFTAARKAALAKAQRASALARKGKASAAGAVRSVTGMRPRADNTAGSGGGRRGRARRNR
jgi:hypothetical protein